MTTPKLSPLERGLYRLATHCRDGFSALAEELQSASGIIPNGNHLLEQPNSVIRACTQRELWEGLVETDAEAAPLLASYWAAVGWEPQDPSVPWSGAFISFCAEPGFRPSPSHITYARSAWKDRQDQEFNRYWAFYPGEWDIEPGDIVLRPRGGIVTNWDNVTSGTAHRPTHGDLVVEVAGDRAVTIGGNVDNRVMEIERPLVDGSDPKSFAVLRFMEAE